jgi:hypothetical protein
MDATLEGSPSELPRLTEASGRRGGGEGGRGGVGTTRGTELAGAGTVWAASWGLMAGPLLPPVPRPGRLGRPPQPRPALRPAFDQPPT